MKRFLSFFTIFIFINLNAQNNLSYSIKLGTYKYLKNVKKIQKKLNLNTYIIRGKNFYGLYIGHFEKKLLAKKNLKKIQKHFKDAYITTSFMPVKQSKIKKQIKFFKAQVSPKIVKKDHLKMAKTYYQIGAYEKALTTLDQLLINNPNNNLARLEYARTLYMLGFYKNATIEFHTVLQANPPKTVQDNINAYLNKINALSRKHYFYGSIGIGLTYDDNLDFNTHLPTTIYGGLELQNDTSTIEGIYTTLNFALMHLYAGEYFNWSNTLYSYNEFQNENIDNFNFLNFITTLSKKYKTFKVSLPLGISTSWFDGTSYNMRASFNPTLNFQTDESTYFVLLMKYQNTQILDNHDKNYKTFGTKVSMIKLFDTLNLYANGTLEKDIREYKKRYDISRDRVLLSAGLHYQLLKKSILHLGYQYNVDEYSHIDPALGYKRKDTKNSYNASIKHKLSKNASATIGYQKLINDSNINFYSYKKNSYNMSYQHSF